MTCIPEKQQNTFLQHRTTHVTFNTLCLRAQPSRHCDGHSAITQHQQRLALLLLQLQAERDSLEKQFRQLYHDKYQPLKVQHQAMLDSHQQQQEQQQQAVEKLRTQLATADLKVRKAGLDVQSLTQQLQKSQDQLQVRPAQTENQTVCVFPYESGCDAV